MARDEWDVVGRASCAGAPKTASVFFVLCD
jgi:hypothetical protein